MAATSWLLMAVITLVPAAKEGWITEKEGEDATAGNVIMAYVNDGTYEYYSASNSIILTRFKSSLRPEGYYSTLTIGN